MSVSSATGSSDRRQDVDRRQRTQAVVVDRRAGDRRTEAAAASNGNSAQSATTTGRVGQSLQVSAPSPHLVDRASLSSDEQGDTGGGFGSFLKSFEGNFDDGQTNGNSGAANIVGASGSSGASPFAGVEATGTVKGQVGVSGGATGGATGSATPAQGLSAQEFASERLRNDISKDTPPQLSVEDTVKLHELDPATGNEAVTNRYYHQAQELNQMLGGDDKNFNATWPAYGQLASNSAGSVLRDDGVPIFDNISDDVAKGNRKVFADIAPRYDSFIEAAKKPDFDFDKWADQEFGKRPEGVPSLLEASKDPNFDLDKYKESLKTAKDENGNPTEYEGAYLRESFDYLNAAINEKDADKKQELVLGSNVLAARHEQQKLQPDIGAATAPVSGTQLERTMLEAGVDKDPKLYLPNGKGSGPMDEYKVDQKLEGKPAPALEEISDPSTRAAVSIGLGGNKVPESIKGQDLINKSGTEDWANLNKRMETITGLMVSTQNSSNTGEYVLDYDQPQGLSTTGNIADVGRNFVEKSGEIFDATTSTLGDLGSEAFEKATSILGNLF